MGPSGTNPNLTISVGMDKTLRHYRCNFTNGEFTIVPNVIDYNSCTGYIKLTMDSGVIVRIFTNNVNQIIEQTTPFED